MVGMTGALEAPSMNRAMAAAGVPPRERLAFLVQAGCPVPAALAEVCRGLPQEPLQPRGTGLGVRPWNLVRFLLGVLAEGLVGLRDAVEVLEGHRIHPWSLAYLGEPVRREEVLALGMDAGLPDHLLARARGEAPGSDFRFHGNTWGDASLEWLPAGLKTGSISIRHCPLAEIGPGLELEGRLELIGCGLLPTLPEDLRALGFVRVWECASFRAMPRRFTATGLQFADLPLLERLTLPASFHGFLEVGDCPSFRALVLGSGRLQRLELVRCPLALLPPDLRIDQGLLLEGLPMEGLPAGLQVDDDCQLRGLPRLRMLGQGTSIGGDLILLGLPALEHIPGDLQVGGQVFVDWDIDLDLLPGHLRGRVEKLEAKLEA